MFETETVKCLPLLHESVWADLLHVVAELVDVRLRLKRGSACRWQIPSNPGYVVRAQIQIIQMRWLVSEGR